MNISGVSSSSSYIVPTRVKTEGRAIDDRDNFEEDSVSMTAGRPGPIDAVRSLEEAMAIVGSLKTGILENKERAIRAQANQVGRGLEDVLL